MVRIPHCKRTCAECPWLRSAPVGRFPPERYLALANTAHDLATRVFACHKSPEGKEFSCAGAILRMDHNLIFRLSDIDRSAVVADGPLYGDFTEMAVANGVPADYPKLTPCRRARDR